MDPSFAMTSPTSHSKAVGQDPVKHRSRGYQLEMLDESLAGNIIVVVCLALRGVCDSMVTRPDGYRKRRATALLGAY